MAEDGDLLIFFVVVIALFGSDRARASSIRGCDAKTLSVASLALVERLAGITISAELVDDEDLGDEEAEDNAEVGHDDTKSGEDHHGCRGKLDGKENGEEDHSEEKDHVNSHADVARLVHQTRGAGTPLGNVSSPKHKEKLEDK